MGPDVFLNFELGRLEKSNHSACPVYKGIVLVGLGHCFKSDSKIYKYSHQIRSMKITKSSGVDEFLKTFSFQSFMSFSQFQEITDLLLLRSLFQMGR